MDKTIKINLGGTLFQADEESYRMLRDYLQAIDLRFRNVPGGNETIEDIELRIAEIFLSQQGMTGVITTENVESMILILGKPEDFGHLDGQTGPFSNEPKRKMYRNPDNRIFGGVCSGIAAYINTDPVLVRILFILFTFFFGMGIFIYLVLWVALPPANSESRRKEMYGNTFNAMKNSSQDFPGRSGIANAFDEIFKAFGKVFFIIFRIFLIIMGLVFVLFGFLSILAYTMVFLFRIPEAFAAGAGEPNLSYIPDFINYIVSPSVAPWIAILVTLVFVLPLLGIIYWGVKMIFWFKAKDGVFSLGAFVVWALSFAALLILLFSEGVGYSERAKFVATETVKTSSDTLYLKPARKVADLKYDHEISIPDERYEIYIKEADREVFVKSQIRVETSQDNTFKMEVRKRSTGKSNSEAMKKAEALNYNYNQAGDTVFLDEYFSFPKGTRWSFDNVNVIFSAPAGKIIQMDEEVENMLLDEDNDPDCNWESENLSPAGRKSNWKVSDDGLEWISIH